MMMMLDFCFQSGRKFKTQQHGQQELGHLLVADTITDRVQRHG